MQKTRLALLALPTMLLCGCNVGDTHIGNAITVAGDKVTIAAPGGHDAVISADGTLDIDGKRVAVDASQKQLLSAYHGDAMKVREHGIAAGMAGAKTGIDAVGSSISGLFKDKSKEEIESDVKASTGDVIAAAAKICHDMARIQSTQDALAAQLPAFRPFARLTGNDVSECSDGMDEARREVQQAQSRKAANG